jgi:hypothetical protein
MMSRATGDDLILPLPRFRVLSRNPAFPNVRELSFTTWLLVDR